MRRRDIPNKARNLKGYLTEQLKRTGYPLELDVTSILERDIEYAVFNNEYYFDWDEKKSREIDIVADPVGTKECKSPFRIVFRLVVECKKSNANAWVFLTKHRFMEGFEGQCMDFLSHITKDLGACFINDIREMLKEPLHYDTFARVAHTHAEIPYQDKVKQSGKNEIFEAKTQLLKFITYDINQLLKRLNGNKFDPLALHLISLYFPIVVLDGKLYEAVLQDGTAQLFERKHILLATTYSPQYVNDFNETDPPHLSYFIDVVRKDYFADFLQVFKRDYESLLNCTFNDYDLLMKKVHDYIGECSKPEFGVGWRLP